MVSAQDWDFLSGERNELYFNVSEHAYLNSSVVTVPF